MKNYLLPLFFFGIFCGIRNTSLAQIPMDQLVGYYTFNYAGLKDKSPEAYEMRVYGTPNSAVEDRAGNAFHAIHLDGGSGGMEDITTYNFQGANSAFTIAVWFKAVEFDGWVALVNKWQTDSGYYIGRNPDNQKLRFNLGLENVADPIESTTSVVSGEWYHLVASYDGAEAKLYMNGILENSFNYNTPLDEIDVNPFCFGIQANGSLINPVPEFHGSMDELLVYNRAITQAEVTTIFNHTPEVETISYDIALDNVDIKQVYLNGETSSFTGTVINQAVEPLTSFLLTWNDGTNNYSQLISGINIAAFESYTFTTDDELGVPVGDKVDITITINDPNGEVDQSLTNNEIIVEDVYGVSFIPVRKVVLETATGTGCGDCPLGPILQEKMVDKYPDNFIPIEVHHDDSMTLDQYVTGANFSELPLGRVNRRINGVPTAFILESTIDDLVLDIPLASMDGEVSYNTFDRKMTIDFKTTFITSLFGDYRFAAIIVEDSISSMDAGYEQTNDFSGLPPGNENIIDLSGLDWATLPNPVPASQMVYNHVARALIGGYDGIGGAIPVSLSNDVEYTESVEYTVPEEFNEHNLRVIVMLLRTNTGEVVNANSYQLDVNVNTRNQKQNDFAIKIFPNPVYENCTITFDVTESERVNLQLLNGLGQLVREEDFGNLQGLQNVAFSTRDLPNGLYVLNLKIGTQTIAQKIVVAK